MKKLISLAAAALITGFAFAQDTIPPPGKKNFQDSSRSLDTMSQNNKWTDTSLNQHKNWPDTSVNNNMKDPAMNSMNNKDTSTLSNNANNNSANSNNSMPDTVSTHSSVNNNNAVKPMKPEQDSMASKQQETTSSSQTDSLSAATKVAGEDRVIMKDDQVMVVKNGDSSLLDQNITLKSGAVISKDGTVKYSNGTTAKLKNGQYINLNVAESKKSKKSSHKSKG